MNDTAPIFVTGMPRSGTTFLQHLLSQHPQIQIYGQEPSLPWGEWLKALTAGVEFSLKSNAELDYEQPHYAAPEDADEAARRFLEYIRWYLTGGHETPRWGVKSLTQCQVAAEEILKVWPDATWVVCVRDPFRSIESLRNTYDAACYYNLESLRQLWRNAALFAEQNDRAIVIQVDQLDSYEQRKQAVARLIEHVGERLACEVRGFVHQWPVIHKVTPDAERQFQLSTAEREQLLAGDTEFARCVEQLGYLDAVEAAS